MTAITAAWNLGYLAGFDGKPLPGPHGWRSDWAEEQRAAFTGGHAEGRQYAAALLEIPAMTECGTCRHGCGCAAGERACGHFACWAATGPATCPGAVYEGWRMRHANAKYLAYLRA